METVHAQPGVFYLMSHTRCCFFTWGGTVTLSVTSKPESGCVGEVGGGRVEFNRKLRRMGTAFKRQMWISHERESESGKLFLSNQGELSGADMFLSWVLYFGLELAELKTVFYEKQQVWELENMIVTSCM